ncbi:IS3 family transposase [Acinetobacter sp. 1124_18A]
MPVPKHSKELKLKVIKAYLDGSKGYKILSKEFNVDLQTIRLWIENYKAHGTDALNVKIKKTYYSPEFKINAIQMLLDKVPVREVRRRLNLSGTSILRRWLAQYHKEGIAGFNTKRTYTNMTKQDKIKVVKPIRDDKEKSQQELIDELTALRAEVAFFKKAKSLKTEAAYLSSISTADSVQVISELRQIYPLKLLLSIAKIARSTYFYHIKALRSNDKYTELKQKIKSIYHKHKGCYGYRRITLALKSIGIMINHKCVYRLMKTMGLKSRIRALKYRSYKSGCVGMVADNILQRQFKANRPNQKWATDVTEFNVNDEKLYLSPVIDLFNGEIITFRIQRKLNYELVKEMLIHALAKLKRHEKPILHSDQGWQYQMAHYQQQLKQHGLIQSMSRKGNCLDNAVIESFFGILKSECFHGEKFQSIDELEKTIQEYIHYYNHERIKVKLQGLSPVQYRKQLLKTA